MKLFLSKKASEPTYTSNFFSCLTFPCNTISIKQNHKETLEIHCIPLLTELALMSSGISLMLGFLLSCKEMISSTASSSFLWSMSIKFSCSLVPAMVPWKLSKPIGWLSLKCNQTWLFYGQKTTHIMSDSHYFLLYSPFFKHWCGEMWWIESQLSILSLFRSFGG